MRVAGPNFKASAAPHVEGRVQMARKNVRNLGVVFGGLKAPAPTR